VCKTVRKHNFEDYEPDISICHDFVMITSVNAPLQEEIGYMCRNDSNTFRFESIDSENCTDSRLLNYADWSIRYLKDGNRIL